MDTKFVNKLGKLIAELQELHSELIGAKASSKLPTVPQEDIDVLLKTRICLSCKFPILREEKPVRGVHEKCRQEQKRNQKIGGYDDDELMRLGLLTKDAKTGRKPMSRLQDQIEKAKEKLSAQREPSRKNNHN